MGKKEEKFISRLTEHLERMDIVIKHIEERSGYIHAVIVGSGDIELIELLRGLEKIIGEGYWRFIDSIYIDGINWEESTITYDIRFVFKYE